MSADKPPPPTTYCPFHCPSLLPKFPTWRSTIPAFLPSVPLSQLPSQVSNMKIHTSTEVADKIDGKPQKYEMGPNCSKLFIFFSTSWLTELRAKIASTFQLFPFFHFMIFWVQINKEEWSKFGNNQLLPGKVENIGNIDLWTFFRTQEEQWSNFGSFKVLIGKHEKHRNNIYLFWTRSKCGKSFYYPEENQQNWKVFFLGNVWDPGDRVAKESLKRKLFSSVCQFLCSLLQTHRIHVWYMYITTSYIYHQ